MITDKFYLGTHLLYETLIWMDWLETENFPLAMWYAQERSVIAGIPSMDWPLQSHWISGEKMQPPFRSEVITYLANHWFPGDHEFDSSNWKGTKKGCFCIIDFSDALEDWPHAQCEPPNYGYEWVILEDRHCKHFKTLSQSLLRKFHFDLERWYHMRLAHELQDLNAINVWDESEDLDNPETIWGYLLEMMNNFDTELASSCSHTERTRLCLDIQQQFFECLKLNVTQAQ